MVAGRIGDVREVDGGLEVAVKRRGEAEAERKRFAFVFNCTGPLGTIERSRDPLLRRMLYEGLVRPDQLGIALDCDAIRSRSSAG